MSTFLISYIIFSIFVLAVINIAVRRRKNAPVPHDAEKAEFSNITVANRHKESASTAAPPRQAELANIGDSRAKVVATIILGAFVAILNQTLINVALPHMMND